MAFPNKIAILGLWHLGEIYSAGLAHLGNHVTGFSDDPALIENFKKNIPPLPEPGLVEMIHTNWVAGRLRFSDQFEEISHCNIIWLTGDTPVNDKDETDLGLLWKDLEKSLPFMSDNVFVFVSSQIPVGTSEKICHFINEKRPGLNFKYAYTPENLRLGEAVNSFFNPARIVVGATDEESFKKAKEVFSGLRAEFLEMSPASAEVAKHAINAFLATSISFINDIADICEKTGADVLDIIRSLRSEPRIGPRAFLDAGIGFSGATLNRDLKALLNTSKQSGIDAPLLSSVVEKNESRKNFVISKISQMLGGLTSRKVAIFGLAYKAGTKTLRRSRAIEVAKELEGAGVGVVLHDPEIDEEELKAYGSFNFIRDPYGAATGADSLLFITPWPQFLDLDFDRLKSLVRPGALFFDTGNFFWDKEDKLKKAGFKYIGIGRKQS